MADKQDFDVLGFVVMVTQNNSCKKWTCNVDNSTPDDVGEAKKNP